MKKPEDIELIIYYAQRGSLPNTPVESLPFSDFRTPISIARPEVTASPEAVAEFILGGIVSGASYALIGFGAIGYYAGKALTYPRAVMQNTVETFEAIINLTSALTSTTSASPIDNVAVAGDINAIDEA